MDIIVVISIYTKTKRLKESAAITTTKDNISF